MATETSPKWRRTIFALWLLGLFGFSGPLMADEGCAMSLVSAQIDQDLFLEPFPGVNEDRDYTMGLFFTFASCRNSSSWFSGHEIQHFLMDMLPIGGSQTQYLYSTAFESVTYTPDDLAAQAPVFVASARLPAKPSIPQAFYPLNLLLRSNSTSFMF